MDLSRITLRPFNLSDINDFMAWANDDHVIRFTGLNGFTSKEDGLRYLKEIAIPHPWRRSICLDDRSIGFVSIYPG
ncbi:GNAT domain [Macleaya cordata]|uniref:GNAT domain n=1 Tax=Macleaya cordata TaxID=56857 RepID=A0A200QYM8_MACCD|nr:GNAT domain [Macleaya cordata]